MFSTPTPCSGVKPLHPLAVARSGSDSLELQLETPVKLGRERFSHGQFEKEVHISRCHCTLLATSPGNFEVQAMSSTNNPLWVRKEGRLLVMRPNQLSKVQLAFGDQIWLDKSGRPEFVYELIPPPVKQWSSPEKIRAIGSPQIRKRRSSRLRSTMLGSERQVLDFLALIGLAKSREDLEETVRQERLDGMVLDHLDRQELQHTFELAYGDAVRLEVALDELHNKRLCNPSPAVLVAKRAAKSSRPGDDAFQPAKRVRFQDILEVHATSPEKDSPISRATTSSVQAVIRSMIAADSFRSARQAAITMQRAFRRWMVQRKSRASTVIQAMARGMQASRSFTRTRHAAIVVQRGIRDWMLRRKSRACTVIQAMARGMQASRSFTRTRHAAIVVQRGIRDWMLRRKSRACTVIQAMARGMQASRSFTRTRHAAIVVQRGIRDWMLRRQSRASTGIQAAVRSFSEQARCPCSGSLSAATDPMSVAECATQPVPLKGEVVALGHAGASDDEDFPPTQPVRPREKQDGSEMDFVQTQPVILIDDEEQEGEGEATQAVDSSDLDTDTQEIFDDSDQFDATQPS
eukprot:TRINITY_DN11628_c0_g1_i2.p1 TRINITY_DN11628_c0_g1~~TRINITY_DN11628_c0_g1_i2.p1  ORF type:complete len:576 (+),score=69.87 TRINITY_DN11628_c0_g1_i2:262-1989(+)